MNTNSIRKISIAGILSVITGLALQDSLSAQQTQTNPSSPVQADPSVGAAMDTFSGIYQTPWFNEPSVRQQLQMNDLQYNQLNQAYTTNWNRYNEKINQIGNDNTLNNQQRQDRLDQLNGSFYKSFSTSANDAIADEAARRRYNQLYYQYRGYGAFNDPAVRDRLDLTPAQRTRLRDEELAWNRRMQQYNRDYAKDQDAVLKRYNESRPEFQERVNTILTPRQQKEWNDIVGNRFDIPASVYFSNGVTTTTTAKPPLK